MTMPPELYAALIGLALIIVGSVGAVVKTWTDRIVHDLRANTEMTANVERQTNGTLSALRTQLAAARDSELSWRVMYREQRRLIERLNADPDVRAAIDRIASEMRVSVTHEDEAAVLRRLLAEAEDADAT